MRSRRRRIMEIYWYISLVIPLAICWSKQLAVSEPLHHEFQLQSSHHQATQMTNSQSISHHNNSVPTSSTSPKRRKSRLIRLQAAPFNGRLTLGSNNLGPLDEDMQSNPLPNRPKNHLNNGDLSPRQPDMFKSSSTTAKPQQHLPSSASTSTPIPSMQTPSSKHVAGSGHYGMREPKRISSFQQGTASEMMLPEFEEKQSPQASQNSRDSFVSSPTPTPRPPKISYHSSESSLAPVSLSPSSSPREFSGIVDTTNMTASSQTLVLRQPGAGRSMQASSDKQQKVGRHQNHQSMLADASSSVNPMGQPTSSPSSAPSTSIRIEPEVETNHKGNNYQQQVNEAPAPAESISSASNSNRGPAQSSLSNAILSSVERELNNLSDTNKMQTTRLEPPINMNINSNPFESQFDSIMSLIDDFDSKIITNRSKAQLSCDSGEMIVRLNFTEPFKGIVYPDHNRLSPCRFFGDGHHNYELRLPLRGCGTRQAAPRVFVNDVVVRFHKSLELEEDEVKTLICRYPAPSDNPAINMNSGTSFDNSQQDQFEFLESPRRNNNNFNFNMNPKNVNTQIDTISENLLVGTPAPPSFGQNPFQTINNNKHLQTNNYNNNNNDSLLEPWQMIGNNSLQHGNASDKQKNLALIDFASSLTNNRLINANSSSSAINHNGIVSQRKPLNFFAATGPLELLLLISSLMFLILLALAFSTSYYCMQRRRQRRLLSSRSALAANVAQATGGHFMQMPPKPGKGRQMLASEGDLSAGGATYDPSMKQMKPLSQNHQQQSRLPPGGETIERRGTLHSTFWTPTLSDGLVEPGLAVESNRGRRENPQRNWTQDGSMGQTGRQLSRRSGPGNQLNRRWPNETQLVEVQLRNAPYSSSAAHYRMPGRGDARNASKDPFGQSARTPNHLMGGPPDRCVPYAVIEPRQLRASEHTWHNFGSTSQSEDGELLGSWVSGDAIEPPNGYQARINAAGNDSNIYSRQNVYMPSMNSATGFNGKQQRPSDRHMTGGLMLDQGGQEYVVWNEQHQSNYYKQQVRELNHQNPHRVSFAHARPQTGDKNKGLSSGDSGADGHSLSGDELLSEGHNSSQQDLATPGAPKLIVKSIEDSYIKKFTEIDRREYLSRDSRQPLSLAEWRTLAANHVNMDANKQHGQQNQEAGKEAEQTDDDEELWHDSGEASGSNLANPLRSLSEVDISFARPVAPTTPANQGANNNNTLMKQRIDVISNRELPKESGKLDVRLDNSRVAEAAISPSSQNSSTPDLIISPEYRVDDDSYSKVRQLQLRHSNPTDHDRARAEGQEERIESPSNSVSYV